MALHSSTVPRRVEPAPAEPPQAAPSGSAPEPDEPPTSAPSEPALEPAEPARSGPFESLTRPPGRAERVTHVERVAARVGRHDGWPEWTHPALVRRWAELGITHPWTHQRAAAEHARQGRHVVLSTGTASGKSLAYLLPSLTAIAAGRADGVSAGTATAADAGTAADMVDGVEAGAGADAGADAGAAPATALYIAPTKALAADQYRAVADLAGAPGVDIEVSTYDGDTPWEERDWARRYASYILTNPDMLHRSMLPGHARWARFFGALTYVIVDECHHYRGVFGSHVAQVLRRLRRIAAHYGADPVFVLASATVSDPAESASRLTGVPVVAVEDDGSPRGELVFALWEPPLTVVRGEHGAPVRRTATAEAADLLTDLVLEGVRTVTFIRSRRGAEAIAMRTRDQLTEVEPTLAGRVASYRGGYLPEERRELERALHRGDLMGVAATNALELGVDISGLDAVVLAGYPGTRNSMWQQAGRAGRAGKEALAVLVARDDPLDTYLVHHPASIFGAPVEATVFDPDNPYVLRPHLAAAAAELALRPEELATFGLSAEAAVRSLERAGYLRRRKHGWFWTRRERACDLADIRSGGGSQIRVVELDTGRLLGTVDAGAAHSTVHAGAVYVHRGESYLVERLDLDAAVAFVSAATLDYSTTAREVTDIGILTSDRSRSWGAANLAFGSVQVTNQVVSFLRRRLVSGEVLGEAPLDLPSRSLRTRAVWWTLPDDLVAASGVSAADLPGAAHAAEHASIGLLPLFATCDRWDIGGVSTDRHADTGQVTVFVYDGHPGGAGFAERAYATAEAWLRATREAIGTCECREGCPSCVQSPKCGNGNNPLNKTGAIRLLDALLAAAPAAV